MAKKELVKLRLESDPQSSKKLKGKVLKAGDIGLDLVSRGRAPGYAHVDGVQWCSFKAGRSKNTHCGAK